MLGATRGELYTWGGEFTWVDQKKDKAGHVTTKRDSHKGCLGLGDADGRLIPTRYTIFQLPTQLCIPFSHAADDHHLMIIRCLTARMLFQTSVLCRYAVVSWLWSVAASLALVLTCTVHALGNDNYLTVQASQSSVCLFCQMFAPYAVLGKMVTAGHHTQSCTSVLSLRTARMWHTHTI